MKRPGAVWTYCILVVLGILFSIGGILLFTPRSPGEPLPTAIIIILVLYIIASVPMIVFTVMFFMLKRQSLVWMYVAFGIEFIVSVIRKDWIMAVGALILGWAVWDYIVHKKVGGNPVFT